MRPDELSALAAIDLLEMMFKSGLRLDGLRDRLMRSFAMPFAVSRIFSVRPR
jgi:hypothetical protein